MSDQSESSDLQALTTKVVASHVASNTVAAADLPKLIQPVYDALAGLSNCAGAQERPQPAVSVKRSVTPDYIICLKDGKKLKMLKRHLKTSYGLTPDEYRER